MSARETHEERQERARRRAEYLAEPDRLRMPKLERVTRAARSATLHWMRRHSATRVLFHEEELLREAVYRKYQAETQRRLVDRFMREVPKGQVLHR